MSHLKTPTKRWRGYTPAAHRTPNLDREREPQILHGPTLQEQRRQSEQARLDREIARQREVEERARESLERLRISNLQEQRARRERARKARAAATFDDNAMDFDELLDYQQDLAREHQVRSRQRRRQRAEQQRAQAREARRKERAFWSNVVNQQNGRHPPPPSGTL